MGSSYYYTIASLPMLFYDAKTSISREDFLYACSREMNSRDFRKLQKATINEPDDPSLLKDLALRYWLFEKSLRNHLAVFRAKAQGKDPAPYFRSGKSSLSIMENDKAESGAEEAASAAYKIDSPLEAEDYLNKIRWEKIDEMVCGHFFDYDYLEGYYLKLQILERKSRFDRDKGQSRYEELYGSILKNTDTNDVFGKE